MERHETSSFNEVVRDRSFELPVDDDVTLRLITLDDADDVLKLVMDNLAFLKPWVGWATESFNDAENREFIEHNLETYDNGTAYALGIYEQDSLRGVVDIRGLDGEAEVGYWLSEDAQGRGLATRGVQALVDYARARHPIERIVLHTYEGNEASGRVAERLGFDYEGMVAASDSRQERRYVKEFGSTDKK